MAWGSRVIDPMLPIIGGPRQTEQEEDMRTCTEVEHRVHYSGLVPEDCCGPTHRSDQVGQVHEVFHHNCKHYRLPQSAEGKAPKICSEFIRILNL